MKVGVLAHSFPRFPGDTHGPFVKDLSEAVARRGHSVSALIPWDPLIGEDSETPLAIDSFRYVWPSSWHLLGYSRTMKRDIKLANWAYLQAPLYFAFGERALRRQIRNRGLDLVHAHWLLPNGFIASRACAALGIPFAVTLHGSDIFMAERNLLFRRMASKALAAAAHVTSCSADLRDRLLDLGGTQHGNKVHLVANGTNLVEGVTPSADVRSGLGVGTSTRLLVGVGRMVDKKGFRFLLEGLPRVLESIPDLHLVLGGGGPLQTPLEALARDLGIADRVSFPGVLSHPEVLDLIAASDVFVMPSVRDPKGNIDGLPIVVLEAMAAGKAVVATDIAGMPLAVVPGQTGELVPEQNPRALSDALIRVLDSPQEALRLGSAGRDRVRQELNWDAIAETHDRLYQKALGG